MKKAWVWVVVAVVAVVVGILFMGGPPRDLSKYNSLKDPQISSMEKQNMLVIELKGDPNKVGKETFGKLYKTFFSMKDVKNKAVAPRARWIVPDSISKEEFTGYYGLPVPDNASLPAKAPEGVKIEAWEYGDVAEILHLGSYGEETPTIEKLQKFIAEKGYKIAGLHEEEYLKGPESMFSKPKDYVTIIRYQVRRK
ncbi:hypothetical protein CO111_00070 [Candidatus Desantisbacteria bacterium CG_4_9_14_3_um_filter_50_7]|nr:MAG: hypothetical protein CO111_00070 [Candidatus Desantisbacteria bacterium CG_4_9_14_3_um_filter_50_7]